MKSDDKMPEMHDMYDAMMLARVRDEIPSMSDADITEFSKKHMRVKLYLLQRAFIRLTLTTSAIMFVLLLSNGIIGRFVDARTWSIVDYTQLGLSALLIVYYMIRCRRLITSSKDHLSPEKFERLVLQVRDDLTESTPQAYNFKSHVVHQSLDDLQRSYKGNDKT